MFPLRRVIGSKVRNQCPVSIIKNKCTYLKSLELIFEGWILQLIGRFYLKKRRGGFADLGAMAGAGRCQQDAKELQLRGYHTKTIVLIDRWRTSYERNK